jgi:hypothetical protein
LDNATNLNASNEMNLHAEHLDCVIRRIIPVEEIDSNQIIYTGCNFSRGTVNDCEVESPQERRIVEEELVEVVRYVSFRIPDRDLN